MNKRFYILFLFLVFTSISVSGFSQDYWLRSVLPNADMTLNKVTSVDSVTYYVACDSGKVLRTTNAGLNWTVLNTGIPNDIRDVDFINANTGYAIAWEYGLVDTTFYGSIILKTTDAGQTWDSHYKRDDSIFYRKISFINSQFGFLLGEPVGIVRTTNGGSNWVKDYIDTNGFVHGFPVWDIKTIGTQFGIACGGFQDLAGVIWRTTNAGINWTSQGVAPEPLFALHFYDNENFIAVGGDFEYGASLVKTTNAGVNWDYTPLNEFGIGFNLSFRTESDGWIALGLGQKFLYTFDGGFGWRTIPTPNLETILDVHFSSKRHGIAVGQHAAILIYNSSLVGIDNNTSKLPSSIELKQNYPNPFNPETIISFSLDKPKYVSLKIYDTVGKEIKTLVDGITGPGDHKIRFDASEIPAGVYFYTLKTDNQVYQTKKMILVK